jgi:NitT/TauT family transport system substrate-binding protein
MMKSLKLVGVGALIAGLLAAGPVSAQKLEKLTMVVFQPPSLGAFLPPVIKAKKFDEANGLDIEFTQRPPDAYTVQFNTGEFKVGGSAAVLTVGIAATRGVKVQYLFNIFNYQSYVVTSRPDVKTLKDLEGKNLAAAKSTSSFRIFTWFAKQQGVDISKVSVVNTAAPGLMGYALADRAAGVQIWDPGHALLMAAKPSIRSLDLHIHSIWKKNVGTTNIPYLGVAAHTDWIKEHPKQVQGLFNTYKAAVKWTLEHPAEAAKIIVPKKSADAQKAIADLIAKNTDGMNVQWASNLQKELLLIYKVGMDVGYLPSNPGAETIYSATN